MKGRISTMMAGLCCLLAVQVAATAAATDTSTASSTGASRGRVLIECVGKVPKQHSAPARGRCTVSGAIADQGRFVDSELLSVRPHVRTLFGAQGTIRMSVYEEPGRWRIVEGTRAYADLRGRGWESRSPWRCHEPPTGRCFVSLKMTGAV